MINVKQNKYVINNEDEIFANRTDIENWINDKNCARLVYAWGAKSALMMEGKPVYDIGLWTFRVYI